LKIAKNPKKSPGFSGHFQAFGMAENRAENQGFWAFLRLRFSAKKLLFFYAQ